MKLDNTELTVISACALFKGASQSVISKVLNATDCTVSEYEKGETVYSKTSFSRSLGIVVEGRLRVLKENADNRPIVMSTLSKGALFGAAALFNDESEYVTSIIAIEHCKILFMSQRLVRKIIERESLIANNYIQYLSERILFLNKKLYFLTAGTAEQRLASFVLDNLSGEEKTQIPLPMNMLADALNMSRASLYRAVDSLVEYGAIIKNGKQISVINEDVLRDFCK